MEASCIQQHVLDLFHHRIVIEYGRLEIIFKNTEHGTVTIKAELLHRTPEIRHDAPETGVEMPVGPDG